MTVPRTIIVATDFSPHAEGATRAALELAARLDARVHLLHAYSVPVLGPGLTEEWYSAMTAELESGALRGLDEALQRHKTAGVNVQGLIKRGDPRDAIVEAAEELGADLIVMGTHGRRGVARALLGSVAEWVVRHASCPVLTVPL